ncbi:MAG: nitroreductase family protein [Thermoplasmatales archaeon]|nr:nitroreductase family protein [Thermoplasmatales archaeon]
MKKLIFLTALLFFSTNLPMNGEYIYLPPPHLPEILLEDAISRRVSIREFSEREISLENISSLLWATNLVASADRRASVNIYVIMEGGVYRYIPSNHSLKIFRKGDFRWVGDYDTAYLKIGLTWNKSCGKNENFSAFQMGSIGQNIYFISNSLNLGTVTTAGKAYELYYIGLPIDEKPLIIMPVGYPSRPYNFYYSPYNTSLPFPGNGSKNLVDAMLEKNREEFLYGELNEREISQLLWASYGYSYFFDALHGRRHRTVPSSHATYPLEIFFANSSGFFHYLPENHSLELVIDEDVRGEIWPSWARNANLFFIYLNLSKAGESWAWYYEAGAIWQNLLLEATSLNLSANVIPNFEIGDKLKFEGLKALLVMEVGKKYGDDFEKPVVRIVYPEEKFIYILGKKLIPSKNTIIIGGIEAEIEVKDDALLIVEYRVNGKIIGEGYKGAFSIKLPHSLIKKSYFEAIAFDYSGNKASDGIEYLKIL